MKVKTLKSHSNAHGDTFVKKRGAVYEHPNPIAIIASGFVERADDVRDETRGRSGDGGGAIHTEKRNVKKSDKKSDAKSSRADDGTSASESADG